MRYKYIFLLIIFLTSCISTGTEKSFLSKKYHNERIYKKDLKNIKH